MISCDLEGVSKSEQNEDNDEEKVGKVDDRPAPTPVLRLFLFFRLLMAHFHFVLSLGAVIAIFSGIIFNGEKIVGSKNLLPSSFSTLSLYHLVSTFIGILLTFSPMHFLGFNVMPRRMPDFPDSFHSWNFLSSIGSGITFLSFAIFISWVFP